ncbi:MULTISPECIES: CehA/McbA family metallohydrolase [unclassified Bradyrhizobium]|uniref:CehA/McbA family metallohydrolase n=1 Tax=unclassified Bradyrhizobium TaxID=2631580 RepID=UPI002479D98B|nr:MULTISPECIES: CehA/McbA family metallohydrolase [unclassified Bradyrhizobium]WGR72883.1 CehA/McbA family metallohydrolase [Bradyrhizobium sp. ISRA426]WGR77718.1 CehA/McbA family metallohydrolase [Bradyrhizobium sp. ISRA430]WGR88123.1 CehA/McbA family metallohydrolase [Bradyrhizobium sp. ISRA432]
MKTPSSPHFTPVDLKRYFNARRANAGEGFADRPGDAGWIDSLRGLQTHRGMPFLFGSETGPDVLELRPGAPPAVIALPRAMASYVLFVQVAADRPSTSPAGFGEIGPATLPVEGNPLGERVATYGLRYADGSETDVPVLRRFAIQQNHISWSASAFAALPLRAPIVHASTGEDFVLGRAPGASFFQGEARTQSGRMDRQGENLWLYALPNPYPDKELSALSLRAEQEISLVFAVTTTALTQHPLRLQGRRKLKVRLPPGGHLNKLGELDVDDRGEQIGMDLGTVISARAVLEYSRADWLGAKVDVQPVRSANEVIVEYSAHPDARLYLRADDGRLHMFELRSLEGGGNAGGASLNVAAVEPATRPVKIRIVEKGSGVRVAARLHVHGAHGEYLPPKGHHRKVNTGRFEDFSGEFANGLNQYAYVDGSCEADLPLGPVFVEICRGFEVRPLRTIVEITATTDNLTFELDRVLRWREQGWVSSDTHVHFLSPQTALLEGKAEGVNVVNLLAAQWGELFTNVADFDGRTTIGAKDFGGDGEFLVRVGTENRMQVLGHISLLGYEGEMINPLSCGGSNEAAIGHVLEATMADWAERCRQQGGLVVMPHAPNPQAERAADIVLGLVDAIEMMSFNPRTAQISAFGLADWYRYLNIGYHLPLVAGSDKMDAAALLGGSRTYVRLGERDFTYRDWMDAVRSGDTFITVGPLVEMTVEGRRPGGTVALPRSGGTLTIEWRIESVSVSPARVELICNGTVLEEVRCGGLSCKGQLSLPISESSWIALRVRGSVAGREADIAAHTSAVYVKVGGMPIFATADAVSVLAQIEGSIAYMDTLAPKSDEARHARLRAALELAHHRLHHRLHELGASHHHAPVHSVHVEREH